jgi:hypothetical protein
MKIYFNGYKHNWISPYTIKEKFFFWKKDYDAYKKEPPGWLTKTCQVWQAVANVINPEIRYIKIDRYDVWNMNDRLAIIILPMLKELNRQKHGAPFVDDEDVPYGLRSFNSKPKENEHDTDDFHFMRWDWIMDELVWTFTALHPETDYEDNYSWGNIDFIWMDASDSPRGCKQMHHGPKHNHRFDKEGLKRYHARVQNGLRLFGKYYRNLWD